jgi:hypothetical protein
MLVDELGQVGHLADPLKVFALLHSLFWLEHLARSVPLHVLRCVPDSFLDRGRRGKQRCRKNFPDGMKKFYSHNISESTVSNSEA